MSHSWSIVAEHEHWHSMMADTQQPEEKSQTERHHGRQVLPEQGMAVCELQWLNHSLLWAGTNVCQEKWWRKG